MNIGRFDKLLQRVRNLHPADPETIPTLTERLIEAWEEDDELSLDQIDQLINNIEASSRADDLDT
jgi:hypothetical protein